MGRQLTRGHPGCSLTHQGQPQHQHQAIELTTGRVISSRLLSTCSICAAVLDVDLVS